MISTIAETGKSILHNRIKGAVESALDDNNYRYTDDDVVIRNVTKEFEGHKSIVLFKVAKKNDESPQSIGEVIGNFIKENDSLIDGFEVVKGFLNIQLSSDELANMVNTNITGDTFGLSEPTGEHVMLEYSSPNTNKPLHLGHLRNNFVGDSMARIFEANGYNVSRVQLLNDRGIHICATMAAWKLYGNGETPNDVDMKPDHFVAQYYLVYKQTEEKEIQELIHEYKYSEEQAKEHAPIVKKTREYLQKWEDGDPEIIGIWKKINGWVYDGIKQTYERMGVEFDEDHFESDTYLYGRDIVLKGLEDDVFYQKEDGSIWCDLSDHNFDDKLLLRSDGTSVYMTQDIGTAVKRFEENSDLQGLVYVVGDEQKEHFEKLFIILNKLGYSFSNNCHHLSYGMVYLPHATMKTREGNVVDADDIMEETVNRAARKRREEITKMKEITDEQEEVLYEQVGVGAIKFYLLTVDPSKAITFDPEKSLDIEGDTAPYFQYSHARSTSVFDKAVQKGFGRMITDKMNSVNGFNEVEKDVIIKVLEFPEKIEEASKKYNPSVITNYIIELTRSYNRFFAKLPILGEDLDSETIENRLTISKITKITIKNALYLLGIEAPNKM